MSEIRKTDGTKQASARKSKNAKQARYAYRIFREALAAHGMFPPLHLVWTGYTFKPDPKRTPGFPTLADYRKALHAENLVIDGMRESAFAATQQKFRRKKIGAVATYLSFKGNLSYNRRLAGALIEHSPVFRQVLRLTSADFVVAAVDAVSGLAPTIVEYRKVLPALTIASREGKRVMALVLHAIKASQSVVIAAKADPQNVMQIVKRFYLDTGWTDHAWRSVNNACSGSDRLVADMPPALVNALAQAGAVSKLPQLGKVGIAQMVIALRHSHAPARLFQSFANALVGPHTEHGH